MAHELNLGGTIYISSKRAAQKTGYSQDYIGQLARTGKVVAQRIGGLWYLAEDSLREHKNVASTYVPTPPVSSANQSGDAEKTPDTLLSFDGKKYISAAEAAKITSYNQDYVGQLARSGTIASRQVGNRWYVDAAELKAHKAEKDRLLAAVQADSVGLPYKKSSQQESPTQSDIQSEPEYKTHYHYSSDANHLFPPMGKEEIVSDVHSEISFEDETRDAEPQRIPIKIVRTQKAINASAGVEKRAVKKIPRSRAYVILSVVRIAVVAVLAFNINLLGERSLRAIPGSDVVRSAGFVETFEKGLRAIKESLRAGTSKEIRYQRAPAQSF